MSGVSGGKSTGLMAAAGASPPRVQYTLNDVLYIGPRFYAANGAYISYAEFQNNGADLYIQNYAGEVTLSLATPYTVSAGVSYKAGTANWLDGDKYDNTVYNLIGNSRLTVTRLDVANGLAYSYEGDGTTKAYSGLDSYTGTVTTTSQSSRPFTVAPNVYSSSCNVYVQKTNGGIAILNPNASSDRIFLRNYANNTTTTLSSHSELDISSFPISSIFMSAMSLDGTKVSIYYRNTTSTYDIQTWTLSTPFDLSTAGTPTATLNAGSSYILEGGWFNRDPDHNYLLGWNQYGDIDVWTWTVDGDISTFTKHSDGNRSNLGFYRSCCSSIAYFDEGNYLLNVGYSGASSYVFGPLSTPYSWEWQDGEFTPRGGTSIYWVSGRSDIGSVPPQDGQFDAEKENIYGGFYSSTYNVYHDRWGIAGDPTTAGRNYNGLSSTAFTGWTGSYGSYSLWVDRNADKVHFVDNGSTSGTYFIFDVNTDGSLAGTYNTSPTGFSLGMFYQMYNLQPLSADGKYFVYRSGTTVKVIELNTEYNPIDGYTIIGEIPMAFLRPDGAQRFILSPRLYVQDQIIFVTQDRGNKTAKIDILIDGEKPVGPPPAP